MHARSGIETEWSKLLLLGLQQLLYTDLKFELIAQAKGRLPDFWGSMLRGSFGHAFKDNVCMVAHRECKKCMFEKRCPYPYVFETPRPENSEWMRRYDVIPHPFVLLPPPPKPANTLNIGDKIQFSMRLFGPATELVPYFIMAWDQAAEKGLGFQRLRFKLNRVLDQADRCIYQSESELEMPQPQTFELMSSVEGPLTLKLITPFRMKSNGKILENKLPFDKLIAQLLRRVSMLLYFHANYQLNIDYAAILENAKQVESLDSQLTWQDLPRWSNRQQAKMNFGGISGQIIYGSKASEFVPLLQAGSICLAGKNTSFGLGQYSLQFEKEEAK